MSLFRALFLFLLISTVSACGFKPMYKNGSTFNNGQSIPSAAVYIDNIPDRDGQYLRNLLIDRIYTSGRPINATYKLKLSPLKERLVGLDIKKDASSTITQKTLSTKMELINNTTEKVVMTRRLRVSGSHNVLDNQFANSVSERAITNSLLREIADHAVNELNLYFYNKT